MWQNAKLPFPCKTKSKTKGKLLPVENHIRMQVMIEEHFRVSSHSEQYFWGEDLSELPESTTKSYKTDK